MVVLSEQLTNTTTEQPVVSEIKMRKRPILMIPLLAKDLNYQSDIPTNDNSSYGY